MTTDTPIVSVVMASYCAADHIEPAIQSVLRQSLERIELLIADDASTDATVEIVSRLAKADPRIRLLRCERNQGPAAARNRAFDAARGDWISVVDADDLVHPRRLERLIAIAEERNADIIADNLFFFASDRSERGPEAETLFGQASGPLPDPVTAADLIRAEAGGSTLPKLGYLKPVLRRDVLKGLRYDETLKVAEDYDLLLRLLLAGARLTLVDRPYYFYRRHGASISHRLSEAKVQAMIDAQIALTAQLAVLPPDVRQAFDDRLKQLRNKASFERLIGALKRRSPGAALREILRRPANLAGLVRSVAERAGRRRASGVAEASSELVVVSGQEADPGIEKRAAEALGFAGPTRWLPVSPTNGGTSIDRQELDRRTQSAWGLSRCNGAVIAHGAKGLDFACLAPDRLPSALVRMAGEDDQWALAFANRAGIPIL